MKRIVVKPFFGFVGFIYFSSLFYIVFLSGRRNVVSAEFMRSQINLLPLKSKIIYLQSPHKTIELIGFYEEMIGNILLFIPLPIILYSFWKLKIRTVLIMSFLLTFFIELLQYVFGVGIADIDDIILNTTGAMLGIFLYEYYIAKHWLVDH